MATCYACPYFQRIREKGRINCECATIKMPDKKALYWFTYEYCASETEYKKCVFYKLLNDYYDRKYAEEEGNEQRN